MTMPSERPRLWVPPPEPHAEAAEGDSAAAAASAASGRTMRVPLLAAPSAVVVMLPPEGVWAGILLGSAQPHTLQTTTTTTTTTPRVTVHNPSPACLCPRWCIEVQVWEPASSCAYYVGARFRVCIGRGGGGWLWGSLRPAGDGRELVSTLVRPLAASQTSHRPSQARRCGELRLARGGDRFSPSPTQLPALLGQEQGRISNHVAPLRPPPPQRMQGLGPKGGKAWSLRELARACTQGSNSTQAGMPS